MADPYSGMPTRPDLVSAMDAKGNLKSNYVLKPQENANQASNMAGFENAWAGLKPNTEGLDMYRKNATSLAPSAWANMAASQATQQNAANTANAQANLAMGGLTSGARERTQIAGANAGNMAQQNIRSQDAAQKQSMLANLPGMENQALQPGMAKANAWQGLAGQEAAQNQQNQQFNVANNFNAQNANVGNMLGQNLQSNKANLDAYNSNMSAWAAGKQADATAASKGSSFICTALRSHRMMSAKETELMTRFMLDSLLSRADFFAWYFRHGAKAIELAERQNFDWSKIKLAFVDEILDEYNSHGLVAAQNMYIERACKFVQSFTGEAFPIAVTRPGLVKSIVKYPAVLMLKSTWVWGAKFLKAKRTARLRRRFA